MKKNTFSFSFDMESMSYELFPLVQLFLLILSTLSFHAGTTNPNRSSIGDYVVDEGFGASFGVYLVPKFIKILIWSSTLYQALYLYFQASSSALISTLFPQISTVINCMPFTPISVVGYLFMIIGGMGRVWCFRTLGAFFTFEITIRNSHKLIKTGPYAYVRHPSYTFVFIMATGLFLVHHRLASFFPNNKWIQILSGPVGFLMFYILLAIIFKKRVPREEEELKKTFGKEWIEYASKTKRFIPGVF